MADNERVWDIERFAFGLEELKTVIGADAGPAVDAVKADLFAAMAARDSGNRDGALVLIAKAMSGLAALGDRLGTAEGAMMRGVTAEIIKGLATEDRDSVERNLSLIESQAGTPKKNS